MVTSYRKLETLTGQGFQADVFHVVFADIDEFDMYCGRQAPRMEREDSSTGMLGTWPPTCICHRHEAIPRAWNGLQ